MIHLSKVILTMAGLSLSGTNAGTGKVVYDAQAGHFVRATAAADAGADGRVAKSVSVTNDRFFREIGTATSDADGGARLGQPARSAWVYSAIEHICGPVKAAKLNFLRGSGGDEGDLLNDDTLSAWWREPSTHVSGEGLPLHFGEFIGLTISLRKAYGQAFWILPEGWVLRSRRDVSRLIVAGPRQMTPIKGRGGVVSAWLYVDSNGQAMNLPPWRVLNLKYVNPAAPEDPAGFAPWEAASIHAETEYAAATFSKRLMDRNGDLGAYLVNKSGNPLSDEQILQIQAQLRAKGRAEAQGKKAYPVITADVEIVNPKLDSSDAAFIGQRLADREAIYIAFGVPASFASKKEAYSIGSASDVYWFLNATVMPEARELARWMAIVSEMVRGDRDPLMLSQPVAPERQVSVAFDFDSHPVMAAVRNERLTTAGTLWDRGMPWETANFLLGLGMEPFTGWDTAWVPAARVPVEKATAPTPPPPAPAAAGKGEGLGALDEIASLVKAWHVTRPTPERVAKAERDAARERRWATLDRQRSGWRKRLESGVSRLYYEARRETLERLGAADPEKALATLTKSGSAMIAFDLKAFTDALVGLVRGLGEEMLYAGGDALLADELGLDDPLERENPAVLAFLRDRENLTRDVAEDSWQRIVSTLDEGVSKGESIADLSARIRKEFDDLGKVRARTIAVTETGAAFEQGRQLAMEQAGVEKKEWLSSGDDRVRESHRFADGTVVGIDELFPVGRAMLRHPCDGSTEFPEEVINCRCIAVAALDD